MEAPARPSINKNSKKLLNCLAPSLLLKTHVSVDDIRIFLLASGLHMLGFIRASVGLFGTVSAPGRFSLGQLREILWPHMLDIQSLE